MFHVASACFFFFFFTEGWIDATQEPLRDRDGSPDMRAQAAPSSMSLSWCRDNS